MQWKNAIKRGIHWTAPAGVQELVLSSLPYFASIRPGVRAILSRNARFRNAYAGRRCFVIGNGPSLSKQDLGPLGDEITITMNLFFKHPILERWQPTFHCAADPPISYTPEHLERMKSGFAQIHPQAFFLHYSTREMVQTHKMCPLERTYFVKEDGLSWTNWPTSGPYWDLTKLVPGCPSTAHLAIMLALYLGCSPIYLLGLDSDWLSHRAVNRHFYAPDQQDHGSSDDLGAWPYKREIEGTLRTWIAYEAMRDAAKARGVDVFNATGGGFLDVFPLVDYETLFPSAIPQRA